MESGKTSPKGNLFKPNKNRIDTSLSLGKVPPQAIDMEEAVLGALMLEKDALTSVVDILKAESFYKEAHQILYKAVLALFDTSQPIDMLTVTNYLRSTAELEMVGGAYYIAELTTKVNSAANVEFHARVVAEMAMKRDLINVAGGILKDAYEETTDVFDLLEKTEQGVFKVSDSNITKNYEEISPLVRKALDELQNKKLNKFELGVPSGFTELDRMTSGWQKNNLIIVAARPGMGKTAFVVSAMRNASVDHNRGVAIFSLEMSAIELVNRLLSAEAEIDSEKIKKGTLEEYEWQILYKKVDKLSRAPIFVDDTPGISIRELRTKCRRLKAKHDISMVIIDYLQLMTGEGSGKGGSSNREQEIASISRSLKHLAKELAIPVIALAQLNRESEKRGGEKKPQMSDLRESGSIEQDADMVILLYRPEYYKITEDEQGNSLKNMGEVIIEKHRNGGTGSVWLKFQGQYTKFSNLDDYGSGGDSGSSGGGGSDVDAFTGSFKDPGNFKTLGSKLNTTNNNFDNESGTPPPPKNNPEDDIAPF